MLCFEKRSGTIVVSKEQRENTNEHTINRVVCMLCTVKVSG